MTISQRAILAFGLAMMWMTLPPLSSVAAFKYLQEGMTSPSVSGKHLLTGDKVSTNFGSGGERHTTCIVFWATWSPRSLELLTDLKELSLRLTEEPLHVIAVNVDSQVTTPDIESRVRQTVAELDPPFDVIMDRNLEIFSEFGVIAVPSMAIVDASGVMQGAPSGYSNSARQRLPVKVETMLGLRVEEERAVVTGPPRYQPDSKVTRRYRLALQLSNNRRYETALNHVDTAITMDPDFSAPFNLRGHIRLQLGEVKEAVGDFRRAVTLDSLSISARAGLGRSLLEADSLSEARSQLERTLALDPAYAPAMRDLALCLAASGEFERGRAVIAEAIELNPRDPYMYYSLGRINRQAGVNAGAVKAFQTALEMLFPLP